MKPEIRVRLPRPCYCKVVLLSTSGSTDLRSPSWRSGSREDFAYGGITLYADDFHRLRLSTRFLTSCQVRSILGCSPWGPDAVVGTVKTGDQIFRLDFPGIMQTHLTIQKKNCFSANLTVSPENRSQQTDLPYKEEKTLSRIRTIFSNIDASRLMKHPISAQEY
jgi:hypothetical protein